MKTPHMLSLIVALCLVSGSSSPDKQIVDIYNLTMQLKVPQVVENTQSLGKRLYRTQKITGNLLVHYDIDQESVEMIELTNLTNHSFKVGGKKVTYKALPDFESMVPCIWNAIGSNKTLVFNKSSVCFSAELEPSYALSEPDNDNSLILVFSGNGAMVKKTIDGIKTKFPVVISGYAAGTQGCGCHDYGHLSPTRTIGPYGATSNAVDIASIYGTWKAKFSHRIQK